MPMCSLMNENINKKNIFFSLAIFSHFINARIANEQQNFLIVLKYFLIITITIVLSFMLF